MSYVNLLSFGSGLNHFVIDLDELSNSGPSSKKTMLQMVELWPDQGIAVI